MKLRLIAVAALTGALGIVPAAAQSRVKVGTLNCDVSAGMSMIIASVKDVACTFHSARGDELYHGTIRKFGLDIGGTTRGVLIWSVLAPTAGIQNGALEGEYSGVGASATVVAGVGANALIGGSNQSVTLQPLSVQIQGGLNVAAGVSKLRLHAGSGD